MARCVFGAMGVFFGLLSRILVFDMAMGVPLFRREPDGSVRNRTLLLSSATTSGNVPFGFYAHVYREAAAVVQQLRDVRKYYPEAPVYVMSDGGKNFSSICAQIGNCKFAWRADAHDCWNPKPFLDRFREAASWLEERQAEWTVLLEPDVTLHGRAKAGPQDADAGGLRDDWNPPLADQLRARVEKLGQTFSGKEHFKLTWDRYGLAGGSAVRTKAAVTAFRPDNIDWPEMQSLGGDQVYSSDIALAIALGSHGFNYSPWEGVGQIENSTDRGVQTLSEGTWTFQHHKSNEYGGKPLYGGSLSAEDASLVDDPPEQAKALAIGPCQHCVWVDEADCWPKDNGPIQCPTDQVAFRTKTWLAQPPNPALFNT